MDETRDFQQMPGAVIWHLHFSSSADVVFDFLDSAEKRSRYWAESAVEEDGAIHYVFLNGIESRGRVLERDRGRHFKVEYFDWEVSFDLVTLVSGGCDMKMTCCRIRDDEKTEATAGWVSWLLAMKAAVDFNVDLRNHDAERTWRHGFVDN